MPNPNTGDINPAAESEKMPLNTSIDPVKGAHGSSPGDKYGNRNNKETDGGRENQEMTRKTRSSKNNETGDATHARK